mgnify:FL=1
MIEQLKIITRKDALEKKLKRYFTGKPCKHGHTSERRTHNGECLECLKLYNKTYSQKPHVKDLRKKWHAKFRKENKEEIVKKQRAYRQKNKEELKRKRKTYVKENQDKVKETLKKWRVKNKDRVREYDKNWKLENKEKKQDYNKSYGIEYRKNNLEKIKATKLKNKKQNDIMKKKWVKKKYKNDLTFKIELLLRSRMRMLINEGKMKKLRPSITTFSREVVGLTQKKLIKYIEKQFYPHPKTGEKMTWKNHSKKGWHIDHIKPVSAFDLTNLEEQEKCFHHTNFQPLWVEENLKKSNKYL